MKLGEYAVMRWLKILWSAVRAGWHTLAAAGTLIGILYLGPDLRDLPEQYPLLEGYMPSFEAMLITFGIECVGYIGWMDIRPSVQRRLGTIPEAIALRELTFVYNRGDDLALHHDKWSSLAPRIRLKNTTTIAWNIRLAHWTFILGDDALHALDSEVRPSHSPRLMAGDEELVRLPAMPWRKTLDNRKGAIGLKLVFWQDSGPAQFEVDATYAFELDEYGAELGRHATQVIEDVNQQRSVGYARHTPLVVKPQSTAQPPKEEPA